MPARLLHAAAILAVLCARPAAADSLRCDGGLVRTGDTKLDLLARCGEPAAVGAPRLEERASRVRETPDVVVEERVSWPVERWSYDLGPGAFVRHVELSAGRVVTVAQGARGTAGAAARPAALVRASCEPSAIHAGDRATEVLARCGEPSVREAGLRTRVERVRRAADVAERTTISAPLELWLLDFGPQRFTVIVALEDGVVVAVERGGYGYAPAR